MMRSVLLLFPVVACLYPSHAMAACPPNAIFCDNFNTYCTGGGYPGGAGDPADPDCVSAASPSNTLLQSVWYRTSTDEFTTTACGEQMILDSNVNNVASFPFAGQAPGNGEAGQLNAQATIKDWAAPSALGLTRLIQNSFGSQYTAVVGTDANPLVLSFFVSSLTSVQAPIWYSDGYMELAYGDETYLNRANTDYGIDATNCSPSITQGPYPVVCAVSLPDDPSHPMPSNCPPVATSPPPLHNAIAVGVLAIADNAPYHCSGGHGSTIYHPMLFDGKLWYEIKLNYPAPSTGYVTLLDGTPVPTPPADLDGLSQGAYRYGNFVLYQGLTGGSTKSWNWITLTVKSNTFKMEFRTQEKSASTGLEYFIYSTMDNIPRQYLGKFDRIRAGVGGGCELASSASWTTCASGTARHCINNNGRRARYIDFDDLSLAGGEGFTQSGACCHSNGTCTQELPENCVAAGDVHGGGNTSCSSMSCCPHGIYVWADADADGDVDADDFGSFQRCFTGPTGAMSSDLKCRCFDRGNDNHVDGNDYLEFTKCATGGMVPWSQALTPFCTP